MKKTVLLEKCDGVGAYLVQDGEGMFVVAGPEVNCATDASRRKALAEIGLDEREFPVSKVLSVDDAAMQQFLRFWGPDSDEGVLRRAQQVCMKRGVDLNVEAAKGRFAKARNPELAAALWLLWRDGEHVVASTVSSGDDRSSPANEACQIGMFVLQWDEHGHVSFGEFSSAESAAQHVREIAGEDTSPITIQELAAHRLGRDAHTGADFAEAGLPIMGGCQVCGASIAAYNACPSKTGYWRCLNLCIADQGFDTVEDAQEWISREAPR